MRSIEQRTIRQYGRLFIPMGDSFMISRGGGTKMGPPNLTLQTHFAAPGRIVSGFAITTVWSSSRQHQTGHPLKYNKTNPICDSLTPIMTCRALRYARMAKMCKNPISAHKSHLRHNYHPFVGGRVPRRLRREVNGVITIIGVVPDAGSNPA
jgi:hypothetical protein